MGMSGNGENKGHSRTPLGVAKPGLGGTSQPSQKAENRSFYGMLPKPKTQS